MDLAAGPLEQQRQQAHAAAVVEMDRAAVARDRPHVADPAQRRRRRPAPRERLGAAACAGGAPSCARSASTCAREPRQADLLPRPSAALAQQLLGARARRVAAVAQEHRRLLDADPRQRSCARRRASPAARAAASCSSASASRPATPREDAEPHLDGPEEADGRQHDVAPRERGELGVQRRRLLGQVQRQDRLGQQRHRRQPEVVARQRREVVGGEPLELQQGLLAAAGVGERGGEARAPDRHRRRAGGMGAQRRRRPRAGRGAPGRGRRPARRP